jgi:hypothetical protein
VTDVQVVKSPPPVDYGVKGDVDWRVVAEKVKEVSPEWVMVRDVARSTPSAIRRGSVAAFRPPEKFEVEQRRDPALDVSRTTVYIRYTG